MAEPIKPRKVVKIVSLLFFTLNSLLFLLREFNEDWWFADYQSYFDVSFDLHFKAFCFFALYLFIFYFILTICVKKNSIENPATVAGGEGSLPIRRKNKFLFVFFVVVFLLTAQAILAIVDSVGVASSVGNAPIYALPLLLFSPDGVYYAYALMENNKKRLYIATSLFVFSNIVRGWAGFIIPLGYIFYIRSNGLSKKAIFVMLLGFLFLIPVLLVIRDYFRGGYSSYQLLVDSGFSGFSLLVEYSDIAFKLMLSRFDLYSNYIGVWRHFGDGLPSYVCSPKIENVFAKIILYPLGGFSCTSLGSVLPGEIYEFFRNKGTSFSISSGFFALPFYDSMFYLLSYVFVLILSSIIIFRFVKNSRFSNFFIFLSMVLLFQGWMYQFTYNFLGYIFGIFLLKMTWSKAPSVRIVVA